MFKVSTTQLNWLATVVRTTRVLRCCHIRVFINRVRPFLIGRSSWLRSTASLSIVILLLMWSIEKNVLRRIHWWWILWMYRNKKDSKVKALLMLCKSKTFCTTQNTKITRLLTEMTYSITMNYYKKSYSKEGKKAIRKPEARVKRYLMGIILFTPSRICEKRFMS